MPNLFSLRYLKLIFFWLFLNKFLISINLFEEIKSKIIYFFKIYFLNKKYLEIKYGFCDSHLRYKLEIKPEKSLEKCVENMIVISTIKIQITTITRFFAIKTVTFRYSYA